MGENHISHGSFFRDGKLRADYVIVMKENNIRALKEYIGNLQQVGLRVELNDGMKTNNKFLLIHIPRLALNHFAQVYDLGTEDRHIDLENDISKLPRWFATPISKIPKKNTGEFTSAERIMIINKILEDTKYGEAEGEFGISKLIRLKIVICAFPLHDGSYQMDDSETNLNDRQLLLKYWSNFSVWYKDVPVDMIQKYFGCEIAYYFAWLQFFNIMLVPVSVIGLIICVYNAVKVQRSDMHLIHEVCEETNIYICPTCDFAKYCAFKPLSSYCRYACWTYILDNYLTIIFTILMSFWATLFLKLWKRRSNVLQMRWGVTYDDTELEPRQAYLDSVKRKKMNYVTEKMEPYIPKYVTFCQITVTVVVCLFMMLLVLAAAFSVIFYKMCIKSLLMVTRYKNHAKSIAIVTGCILQVCFIKLFGLQYGPLSVWLTRFENPRTQKAFDNSVLYKRYLLSFVNNYTSIFYIAFVKGRLYQKPVKHFFWAFFEKDTCQPITCIFDLATQLFFLIVFKRLVGNLLVLFWPPLKKFLLRIFMMKKNTEEEIPQYEKEFKLIPTNRYLLTSEFCEMVISFGFITFFIVACPFAPLCVYLNNLIEQRSDAYKLVVRYRRPLPRNVRGIGAWDGIILGITYLSTATNAFVISFTSDFVARQVYAYKYNPTMHGFVNSTLSAFQTKDHELYRSVKPFVPTCYYREMRFSPEKRVKYKMDSDYWTDFTWRLICIFIFEHFVLCSNALLSYFIPDIPRAVKEQMILDRLLAKEAKQEGFEGHRSPDNHDELSDVLRQRKRDAFVATGPIGGFIS